MNVILTPPQIITVKTGPVAPASVSSSVTYFGTTGELPLIQYSADTANTALIEANTAQSQVGAAYAEANASYIAANTAQSQVGAAYNQSNTAYVLAVSASTTANTAQSQVGAAYAEANTAYALAANSLPIVGGEITGNLLVDGTLTAYIDAGSF